MNYYTNTHDSPIDMRKHACRWPLRDGIARFGTVLELSMPRCFLRPTISLIIALLLPVSGSGDVQSVTQSLAANILAYGKLSLPASVTLRAADTRFGGSLSGSLIVSYWARTSDAGSGSVSVQASSEFSPAGGPSISSVTYLCSGATLGTSCSGTQNLTTSSQTPLVSLPTGACTGGGGVCSTQEPNTVLLNLSAPDKPHYKTGTYSALITFTISTI